MPAHPASALPTAGRALLGLFCALAAFACAAQGPVRAQAAEPPAIPPIASVVNLGVVQQNKVVNCRDGQYSALIQGRVYWTFGDTCLKKGGVAGDTFIDNSMAWSTGLDASAGLVLDGDWADSQRVPRRLIPLTAGETAFNVAHAPNELALWPGQLVPDPERQRALIFFGTVYRGADIGFQSVGGGIAVASTDLKTVTRPAQNPDPRAPEPSYLWGKHERTYTNGYLLDGEMLYAYAGEPQFLSTLVHVARVPLAGVLDKRQWRYYTGNGAGSAAGQWSEDPKASRSIYTGGAAGDTLFWSDYLGLYVTVYQTYLNNDVFYRVAHHPEGPWSEAAYMFTAEQGTDVSYAARVHPGYARNGGQVQYITYAKTTGLLRQELPLVEVTFGPPPSR